LHQELQGLVVPVAGGLVHGSAAFAVALIGVELVPLHQLVHFGEVSKARVFQKKIENVRLLAVVPLTAVARSNLGLLPAALLPFPVILRLPFFHKRVHALSWLLDAVALRRTAMGTMVDEDEWG
jgi:hypothetical protein